MILIHVETDHANEVSVIIDNHFTRLDQIEIKKHLNQLCYF